MKTIKILLLLFFPLHVFAQISLTTFGSPYVETFGTTSVSAWTNNSTFPGWYLQAGGTFTFIGPTTNITTGAPPNTGGFYTYVCNGGNDVKLGGRPSNSSGGSSGSGVSYMGMRLKNTSGATITMLRISFDAFQLSLAQNSCNINTLDFSYQAGTTVTSLTAGAWTSVPALQFTAPNNDCPGSGTSNQLAGYPCSVSSNLSACISVSIPNNSEIMLRWGDINNAANDPHLAIDNISVTPFRPVTITAGSATVFCQGDSVTLAAAGGNSYSWSTGATSAAINATTSGTYTVTSTNVCQTTTATQSVTVNPLPTPTITANAATTFCQGDSVTLTASGGTSYIWNTGANTSAITVSTAGTYTVTATNSCGSQTATQSVTVNPLPTPMITANAATTFCQGDSVTLTASGGTSYMWNTGANTSAITVSTAGTYTVTATNSCGSQTATQSVTVNPLPTPMITANTATTFCQGDSVTLTASGGTSYIWNTGTSTSAITVSTAGTYTVTATNSCGSQTATQSVTVNPLPTPMIAANAATNFCQGDSVMLTASGGTSYMWNTGANTSAITVSTAGTYIVTATNSCGSQTATQSVTVNPLPTPMITANTATTFCQGDSVTLTASGGTSYTWNTGASTSAITVSTAGTYTVTATNSCGSQTATQAVTVNPLPTPMITANAATTFCQGDSVTLTASGGTSYIWNTGANTSAITVSTAGTYTVTATNSCGSQTATQAVTVNPLPAVTIHSSTTTVCSGSPLLLWATGIGNFLWSNGDNNDSTTVTTGGTYFVTSANACGSIQDTITLTALPLPAPIISLGGSAILCPGDSVTLTASGGTSYTWNTGASTNIITVSTAGTYTVTASNSCGSASATSTISVSTSAAALVHAAATTVCPGNTVLLWATGTGGYSWSTGETNDSIYVTGGSYILTSTGSCGLASDSVTITQLPLPAAAITSSGSTTICSGSSVTLNASGGTTYLWQPSGATTASVPVTTAGTYTVTASNSCGSNSATITVTVINNPVAAITASGPATICPGNSLSLNASGGSTYLWSTGATTGSINVAAQGTYWVIAGNSCGADTAMFSVITDSVTASFTSSTNSGLHPLPVNFINNSSSNAVTYSWTFGDGNESASFSPSNTFRDPGVYTVTLTVTNASGCTDSDMMQIIVLDNPSTLSIPNVFTPNGDMINDVFSVTASGIKEFECTIFDRWGVKIAAFNSISEGWDGKTTSGQVASDGTYYYIIKARGTDNIVYDKTGFITLVK